MIVLQPHRSEVLTYFERLVPEYRAYCVSVSKRSMALSIESCAYLWYLCDTIKARNVVDLGSGFSSYVLARYAAEADYPVRVDSVDSDPEWLDKTRRFCESHGGVGSFMLGEVWEQTDRRYDVIINDYGRGAVREQMAAIAVRRLTPAGVIMFDDAPNSSHRHDAARVCGEAGLALLDLYHQTVDEVGRFALLGARL